MGAGAVLAGFAAFGAMLAVLAGSYGLRQARRLRRTGIRVQALVKHPARRPSDEPTRPRPLLQFATDDGRVLEIVSPVAPTRGCPLDEGDHVLVRYDPADPRTVVVHGRERLGLERAFVGGGAGVLLLSLALLVLTLTSR